MLCPIAWQSCYTLVTLGISFNFLCSKSEHLSFMLLHTSEFLCYPCDKQQWSVSLRKIWCSVTDRVVIQRDPVSPTRDAGVADKHDVRVMEMLYAGACQILVCAGIPLEGIFGHCQSDTQRKQGRTPLRLHTTHGLCHWAGIWGLLWLVARFIEVF